MAGSRVNLRLSSRTIKTKKGTITMKTAKFEVSKKIDNDLVGKVTRKANVTLAVPETFEEATILYGDELWKWAYQGYRNHARTSASAALLGALGNRDSVGLVRQFGESIRTLVEVMGMPREKAIETILTHEKFKALKTAVDEQVLGSDDREIDYTVTPLKVPKWFSGSDADADEDAEDVEVSST